MAKKKTRDALSPELGQFAGGLTWVDLEYDEKLGGTPATDDPEPIATHSPKLAAALDAIADLYDGNPRPAGKSRRQVALEINRWHERKETGAPIINADIVRAAQIPSRRKRAR